MVSMAQALSMADSASGDKEILEAIDALATNEEVLAAHKEWERIDAAHKDDKTNGSFLDAAVSGAKTRIAYARKDFVFDLAAHAAQELAERSGVIEEYTGEKFGNATKLADVSELSPQWHDARMKGIGGSSLSGLLGFHWKSRNGFPVMLSHSELDSAWREMMATKVGNIPDGEYPPIPDSGVTFRGHAWEEALLVRYALLTGTRIGVTKATWKGAYDFQVFNMDGIILDSNGEPEGIVECKTSSREWTWDKGIPTNYRAQVLWYLKASGLSHAVVLVKFDSGYFEEFTINADETVDGTDRTCTIDEYLPELSRKWEEFGQLRNNVDSMWDEVDSLVQEAVYCDEFFATQQGAIDSATPIVKLRIEAPYVRMDDSYNRVTGMWTVDGFSPVAVKSPLLYPLHPDEGDGIDISEVDELCKDGFIIAADSETFSYIVALRDGDDRQVIHASAVRRWEDASPPTPDFPTVEKCHDYFFGAD